MTEREVRFLADESCDYRVVRCLREAGYDVLAVADIRPGMTDREVLSLVTSQERVLLTEDRDFGWLDFAASQDARGGVVFVRSPEASRATLPEILQRDLERPSGSLPGGFVVWTPQRLRIARLSARG